MAFRESPAGCIVFLILYVFLGFLGIEIAEVTGSPVIGTVVAFALIVGLHVFWGKGRGGPGLGDDGFPGRGPD